MRGAGRTLAALTVTAACVLSTSAYAQHHGHGHHGSVGHHGSHGYYGGHSGYGYHGGGHRYYGGHYGTGHYGLGFYFGLPYGHGGYYGYPYFYGGYYRPAYYYWPYYYDAGAVRLQVEPAQARVFVDGYYVGVVDDFDGRFQRLRLAPGRHEIALKLDGYRTHRLFVYAPAGQTVTVHHEMTVGSGQDELEADVRDVPNRRHSHAAPQAIPPESGDVDEAAPADDRATREARFAWRDHTGEVRMIVQPEDASVYVDGRFVGSARDVRRVDLTPGLHRVEAVRPGFAAFQREIEIEAGQALDLRVELLPD